MSYRHLILAIIGVSLFGPAQSAQIDYTFDMSNGLFSANQQLLEDITGQTANPLGNGWIVPNGGANGSFTYDNAGAFFGDNGVGGSLFSATVTMSATLVSNGSDLGTISGDNSLTVIDNEGTNGDLVNVGMSNISATWSGLIIGQYELVTVGAIWIRGDFLSDETLPGMLPPPPGYEIAIYNFGFVDPINSPSTILGLSALGLIVTPVPVPAAVWLFGTALGLLGWMRRKGA